MINHAYIEDGAHEVVEDRPQRKGAAVIQIDDLAAARSGGMAAMQAAGDRQRREFLMMRRGDESVKLSHGHADIFRALVRCYLRKRAESAGDFGSSLEEIAAEFGAERDFIRSPVGSLLRNRMIRSRTSFVGYQGRRTVYTPSALGETLIGIAEVLGPGAMVKTGLPANAWTRRNRSEPPSIFQCASLISGPQEIK